MNTIYDIFGSFFIALIISYGFTPFAREIAFKFKMLDQPNHRKAHAHPTPLLGGLAVYIAFIAAILFTAKIDFQILALTAGGTAIFFLGIIDDKLGMIPKLKLSVQILAALLVFKLGFRVSTFEDYYLSMIFTVFWIVGITNAFNLLDNLNGLSSGIAGISSVFFGLLAVKNGDIHTATISFALAGACFGFLRHNFPKASIFMGDCGSMLLGFLLSCIAILGTWKTDKISLSLSLPILILGYAIFDTTLVTIIRLIEKRPIFIGGKDHSSHILASLGFRKRRAVVVIYGLTFLLGLSALAISVSSTSAAVIILCSMVAFLMIIGVYLASKRLGSAKAKRRNAHDK